MKSRGFNIIICPICYKLILIDANTEYYEETQKIADEFYKLTKIHIPVEAHCFGDFIDVGGSRKVIFDVFESIPVPPDITHWKERADYRYDYLKQKYGERALELFKKLYTGVIDIPKSYD